MGIRKHLSVIALGFAATVALGLPASAHSAITSTFPAVGNPSTLVDSVSVTANEELLNLGGESNGFVFAVTDSAGHYYGDGCVAIDGPTAVMNVSLGGPGDYTVGYRIVSADGHPLEGSWVFAYAPESGSPVGDAYLELPVCGETPIPVETLEPEPLPIAEEPEPQVETFNSAPIIGAITIPIIIGAIWFLIRLLGKSDSEDHLT